MASYLEDPERYANYKATNEMCCIFQRETSFDMQMRTMLRSIRNVQDSLLKGRRIGDEHKHDNSLTLQHQEKSERGLSNASRREHYQELTARAMNVSSGRSVVHTAAWLAR
jgi:hypothetical protein